MGKHPGASRLRWPGFRAARRAYGLGPFGLQSLTLARWRAPGGCELPTPLRKTPWRRAPVLLRAWVTCSPRRGNRRHACGDTAHEAMTGCHHHGCAVVMDPLIKPVALPQRRFAGRIGSRLRCSPIRLRTSFRLTLAPTCRAAGEKRTSHAKPPVADASDRGSARLRLRAGRTTRSLLSCLVPPSKRPSDRRGQGEASRNDVNHKRKGKS